MTPRGSVWYTPLVTKRDEPKDSRSVTDTKLRHERERADEEVLERSAALGESADEVIKRARDRARLVLDLARLREDRALDATHADASERARIADDRKQSDEITAAERAEADAAISDERSQQRRAIIQLLALERDETDQKLAAERWSADRMLTLRDDMLAVVSHDLRTHLSSMLVRTSLVLMQEFQPKLLAGHMQALQHSIAKMDNLLTDLLDVASMETGRVRVECSPTNLAVVVAEEVGVHRPAAEARSIDLILEDNKVPVMVEIDPARMSRVLMNLLTNAIKFTSAGGRIEVAIRLQANEACVSVKDSGPGIAADQLETVFDKFSRIDPLAHGYGLGLYIARAIVKAHSGRIWAESKAGEGSTFHIRLPVHAS